jgi:pimeloyl-ACP methyl ester carboxylesterase
MDARGARATAPGVPAMSRPTREPATPDPSSPGLAKRPAVVVVQSLDGVNAMLLAARHTERVAALVMADAGPRDGGAGGLAAVTMSEALGSSPALLAGHYAAAQCVSVSFRRGSRRAVGRRAAEAR